MNKKLVYGLGMKVLAECVSGDVSSRGMARKIEISNDRRMRIFGKKVRLHDLPVCERPEDSAVVSPSSNLVVVSSNIHKSMRWRMLCCQNQS